MSGRAVTGEATGTSTAQHSTAQHSTAQHSTAQHSTAQHSTAQHSTAQHSTAQHSTAQHSTAQHSTAQHSTHSTAAQHSTAHTDESFIHQDLFCMPRAHSRNSQSRAEQARAAQTAQTAQTEQSSTGAHPLFTRRRQRGSPALLRTGSCQTGGPICRETKHLADDRPGQQRSSAGITLNMKGGDVNIPWPIRVEGLLKRRVGSSVAF